MAVLHELHGGLGFPPATQLRVKRRENTGAGRYVDVDTDARVDMDDGPVDLGGKFIEMSGVPHGLMAVAHIKDHRVHQIEIAAYGDRDWDGVEREWAIV